MKTSNKILSTAFAAYLLFTAGNSAAILKEYKRAEASGKALITQLEKTSIHVLSVEGCLLYTSSTFLINIGINYFGLIY